MALMLLPLVFTLASCSSSNDQVADVPKPSSVPDGSVAIVGDSPITTEEYRAALKANLSGYDPLAPTRATPEPLDPPKFSRCVDALAERAGDRPDLAGIGRDIFLKSCRERYDQIRELTLSRLIEERWVRTEAEIAEPTISKQEVDSFIEQARLSWASDPAESRRLFRKAVEASGLSQEEIRQKAELAVSRQRLGVIGAGDSATPSTEEAQEAARERFDAWRSKTLCADSLLVPECSNGPEPS